jgi:quercetin dioxygenase-like cupin family protein
MLRRMSPRVARDTGAPGDQALVPPAAGSALSLAVDRLDPGSRSPLPATDADRLLFVADGTGSFKLGEQHPLQPGTAALVPAGQEAELAAGSGGLAVVHAAVGADTDLHAPMGPPDVVVALDHVEPGQATGSRSFHVLFGPHNGSTRATLFVGYVPPGKAPWHYHLYDEIVWVLRGSGRLHLDGEEELRPGATFRLRPREVHIVENAAVDTELVVLGVFTPAGSPSAAYLEPGVAAEYRIA